MLFRPSQIPIGRLIEWWPDGGTGFWHGLTDRRRADLESPRRLPSASSSAASALSSTRMVSSVLSPAARILPLDRFRQVWFFFSPCSLSCSCKMGSSRWNQVVDQILVTLARKMISWQYLVDDGYITDGSETVFIFVHLDIYFPIFIRSSLFLYLLLDSHCWDAVRVLAMVSLGMDLKANVKDIVFLYTLKLIDF